jgi:protoporphyrinogen oxidase
VRGDPARETGTPRVAVLGAGPAGLAAAYYLVNGGVDVVVYEAAPHVGGLGQSFDLWGWRVDLGSHIYAEGQPLADALLAVSIGNDSHRVPMRRGVLVAGRNFDYPLRPDQVARRAPKSVVLRGGAEYLGHYLSARTVAAAPNTKAYMIGRFGKTLSETFFRSYVEKLYGRPWNEIDPEFARALTSGRGSSARATFPYPSQGTGAICEGLARQIVAAGGQIRTNSPAERIDLEPAATIASNGSVEAYDHVISTLPLAVLARGVADAPASVGQSAAQLTARSTVLVYLDIHGSQCFPELWRFVYDAQYRMGRVANVARWWPPDSARPAPPNRTVLCTEYWCTRDDETWGESDGDLALVCERELRACDILTETARVGAAYVRRVAGTHPVPSIDASTHVRKLSEYFATFDDLDVVGRHAVHGTSDIADNLQSGAAVGSRVAEACRRS